MKSEVFSAVKMWNVTPCSLAGFYQRFGGTMASICALKTEGYDGSSMWLCWERQGILPEFWWENDHFEGDMKTDLRDVDCDYLAFEVKGKLVHNLPSLLVCNVIASEEPQSIATRRHQKLPS
jgi:hypothetical protein